MQRVLLLLIAFISLGVVDAKAQRYLPDMQALELRGGTVDGFNNPNDAYFSAAFSSYTKKQNRWVCGVEYLAKEYQYKDIYIPKAQFTAEFGHYVMFLSDYSKTLFISVGASALGGYETTNWGKKLLYDGATLRSKDSFIYGGAVTLEIEIFLMDDVALILNARERALWGSSVGHFHNQLGAGLKFIL